MPSPPPSRLAFLVCALPFAGCAPPRRPAAPAATVSNVAPSEAASPEAPKEIPTECASDKAPCVPDPDFVKRLCARAYPEVALVLLTRSSPFSRIYLRGETEGWNADGGASTRARLLLDEEMLVLKRRAPQTNGIVVGSGGASYLVLRWDGTCFTLEDGEVTTTKPPSPKHGPIPFRFYSEPTKQALLERPKVMAAYQARGKECKGVTSGSVSKSCERADASLSGAIVSEVRSGLTIPTPELRP